MKSKTPTRTPAKASAAKRSRGGVSSAGGLRRRKEHPFVRELREYIASNPRRLDEKESPGTIAARECRAIMNKWTPEQRRKHRLRTDQLLRQLGLVPTPAKPPSNFSVWAEAKRGRGAK